MEKIPFRMGKGLKRTIHRKNEGRRWEMFGLSSCLSDLMGGNFGRCRARPARGCEPNLPCEMRIEWKIHKQ